MQRVASALIRFVAVLILLVQVSSTLMFSQVTPRPDRIAQTAVTGPLAVVSGTAHPLTRRATDLGTVESDMQLDSMTLNFTLSAAQQADLDALLKAQLDPNSQMFHQWLTQEQFGQRFGITDSDLAKVTAWLTAQGFSVKSVAPSRNAITFSGQARQVESAFHTQLHRYNLDGELHFANASELVLPAPLASVTLSVRGLNNFRLKSRTHAHSVKPDYNAGDLHLLAPVDWATIYDVSSIYSAGYNGAGMYVGIVGQTYVPQADINHFRTAAGLSATKLSEVCISSTNCTTAAGTSTDGDLAESDLDIEWAGAIAKNATVVFIYSSHADTTQGVVDALQYAIQTYKVPATQAVVPVLSMSYGGCELQTSASDEQYFQNLANQASAQGQTILNSSGDSGGAGCDQQGDPSILSSQYGLSATTPANVPNITAVGGTTLTGDETNSNYWGTNALGYIPESAWNDSSYASGLAAGGGGVSTYFATPSWQWAPGSFIGTPGRFLPDVAFTASWDHDGYLICSQVYNSQGADCSSGFVSSGGYVFWNGGTSASSPSFAGMLTLLVQKYGPLGNINPMLYTMASNPIVYASVFHDINAGNNIVPCVTGLPGCSTGSMGYTAGTGFDLATGLGSIKGGGLLNAMANATHLADTSTTLTSSAASAVIGNTITLTASVSSATSGTISGQITFSIGSQAIGTAPISGGVATLSNVAVTNANGFTPGNLVVSATSSMSGSTFATSTGTTTVTVSGMPTTTSFTSSPSTVQLGSGGISEVTTLTATVVSTSSGTPTGSVTFTLGGRTVGYGILSSSGVATGTVWVNTSNGFAAGAEQITATYSGDSNFAGSNGTNTLNVTQQNTVTTLYSPTLSPSFGNALTLRASVMSSPNGGRVTGTVTLSVGTTVIGTGTLDSFGVFSVTVTPTPGGPFVQGVNTYSATYSGDSNSLPSSASSVVTIHLGATTTVTVSPSSAPYGSTVNVSVQVSPPTATGTVWTCNNSVTLSGGTGSTSCVADMSHNFTVGTNTIVAQYYGDSTYGASIGTTPLTLTQTPTTITVSASPNVLALGAASMTTTLTANFTPNIFGSVIFTIGTATLGWAPSSGGLATLSNVRVSTANGFSAGTDTIKASFVPGDSGYTASSSTTTVTVSAPAYTVSTNQNAVTLSPGSSTQLTLNLSSINKYAGTVSFAVTSSSTAMTASASPVTLTAGGSGTTTLTINASPSASNRQPRLPWKGAAATMFAAVLAVPFGIRRKRAIAVVMVGLAVCLGGFLVSCGGGGSSISAPSTRTYTVTVTPTGSGTVTDATPIRVVLTVQ